MRWDRRELALAPTCGGSRNIWYSGGGGFGGLDFAEFWRWGGPWSAREVHGRAVAGAVVYLAFPLVLRLQRFAVYLA